MTITTVEPNGGGVAPTPDLVEYEVRPLDEDGHAAAALLTLNRPDALNAISWDMLLGLESCLQRAAADAAVRCVLITGRGRAFSAGGDVKKYQTLQADAAAFERFCDDFSRTLDLITEMHKPVVALVNGIAAAGGLELLLACDFTWMSESARIGDMHLNYGQIGGIGVMSRLPRVIGPGRARELVFSGTLLDSTTCLEWGLVNRVLPDDRLLLDGIDFARAVAAKSANSMRNVKHVINRGLETDLPSALRQEHDWALIHCLTLPDSMEGINAFVEKRQPNWPPGR